MSVKVLWRGEFENAEVNELHLEAFPTGSLGEFERDWKGLTRAHSVGWVTARSAGRLVGFVNVLWDGLVHAWLQDVMVTATDQHRGVGTNLVAAAAQGARDAGCCWLHVDFGSELRPFYFDACGFTPTDAGLLRLRTGET